MNGTNPQAALLDALKAIVVECMDCPPEPRFSHDSYLPPHLIEAAQKAIAEVQTVIDAERFARLKAQFALHGHTLYKSGQNDGPGPVSYLAERWGMARHLPTLDDADKFLIQVGG